MNIRRLKKTGWLKITAMYFLFVLPGLVLGQQTGNEWIHFDQPYYKIPVGADGIYRLTYTNLSAAGFPVGSVNPQMIRLYHRGNEQALFIAGEEDGSFGPSDYIEFFGKRNDGTLDAELYVSPDAQPHGYYNLYSDTTAYFLTIAGEPGKRMGLADLPVPAKPAETFHWDEKLQLYTDAYSAGRVYGIDIYLTRFDYGEGWTGARIRRGQHGDYMVSGIAHTFTSGPQPHLELLLTGRNNLAHNVNILVGPDAGGLRVLENVTFSGYENTSVAADINWSDIGPDGNLLVRMQVNDTGNPDFVSVAYLKLRYPQQFIMGAMPEKTFHLTASPESSLVRVADVPSPAVVYDITDADNIYRIAYTRAGSEVSFSVPGTGRKIFIHASGARTPSIRRVHFRRIDPDAHNYLIISNRLLRHAAGGVDDPVKAYGAYRASAAGGGFDTLVVNMQQLYNQFSYGEITPLSIRRFARFMIEGGDPEYLFLIGRGLSINENPHRISYSDYADLVPSAGEPGADMAFTAGLTPEDPYTPAIPTGRLTAQSPEEVLNYLTKVKEMEATPFQALWRKKLIHLSGGRSVNELNLFKKYVDDFKAVAEDHYLGGQVVTLTKQTNNAVELINIADQVNEGVSLITFFGHSSPEFTDIEIGLVSDPAQGYQNQGKYPMILVNGCDAGNIFNRVPTFGEDWMVKEDDKGAIGFIAHAANGLSPNLKNYTDLFYGTAFGDSSFISKPIGDIQKEVARRYLARFSPSPGNIAQAQQMVYQGDPVIRLFGMDKPDYEISAENLFLAPFENETVTALADSFRIGVIVRNFGITSHDSLWLQVERTFSNGMTRQYDSVLYAPVFYRDTLYYTVQNTDQEIFGENRFSVSLDPLDLIPEVNETNNVAVLNAFINLAGTSNLLPGNFSIVSSNEVELIVQSNGVFPEARDFLIEVDTTKSFDSPLRKEQRSTAAKLATWKLALPGNTTNGDSITYYWRSKFAQPKEGEDTTWSVSSFTYIHNSPSGWAQVDLPQFDNNAVHGLERKAGKWQFIETANEISVITSGKDAEETGIQFFSNGTPYFREAKFQFCYENSINAVAFDKASAAPYLIFPRISVFDKSACGRLPQVINSFSNPHIQSDRKLEDYLDAVPAGDYVLLFSAGGVTYQSWPETTWEKLNTIGAPAGLKAMLQNGTPLIILGKKGGAPGTATVRFADPSSAVPATEQRIEMEKTILGKFSRGTITSPRIGPAASWKTVHTGFSETGPEDEVFYDVIGIDIHNNKSLLFEGITSNELDISTVDSAAYPYLQLRATVRDGTDLSAAQLDKWLVLYTPVPEGVLLLQDPAPGNYTNISKAEGVEFSTGFIFHNISNRNFSDSLTVRYSVFNHSTKTTDEYTKPVAPPAAGDTVAFPVVLSTMNRVGGNDLTVNINPRILPEQNYNNNIIQLKNYFRVEGDNANPLIDVAFDGRYIMDGDIVSPDPLITVIMRDPNALLKKVDTTGMALFLKRPCESCTFEKVNLSGGNVTWSPATEDADFTIEFRPEKLKDGMHTLRVQAEDASGNKAGAKPYSIQFEVINKSSITHFYPYPNPFSTSTRFVFTLTGSDIPDEIKIQILTVTGKIVREITQSELGPIHIGHNISDFAWNGKDEFGDQLANGVYLYRVIIRNKGQGIESRRTAADHAFKKGYGKIYLLR